MKLLFEINTTFSENIFVSIDENITLWDFHKTLSEQINSFLEESETDIIDVFVENEKEIMSIPNSNIILIDYLNNHPAFFHKHNGSIERNIHKIFIMDSHHLKTINNQKKTNIKKFKNIFKQLKDFIPTIYI
jgi:hypothetical protein|tara:strand:+ start:321 stop:716 length:396 start_codon:yes stop_codon:yes gene_type:complete